MLQSCGAWENVPGMIILTGRNGTGKSIVLDSLQKYLNSLNLTTKQFIYIHEDINDSKVQQYGSYVSSSHLDEYRPTWITEIKNVYTQGQIAPLACISVHARLVINEMQRQGIPLDQCAEEAVIRRIGRQVLDYSQLLGSLQNPHRLLEALVELYESRKRVIPMLKISLKELRRVYENPEIDLEQFDDLLEASYDLRRELENKYAENLVGDSPIVLINKYLQTYGIQYRVLQIEDKHYPKRLFFRFGKREVLAESLSSGEKAIIAILAWDIFSEMAQTDPNVQIRCLLWDEIDKYFDAKMCRIFLQVLQDKFVKKGIQVFLATHRPDTLIMAPNDAIFTLENDENGMVVEVRQTHKLLALCRLTSNLYEILGHKFKVYTESTTDAYFFDAVYSKLFEWCEMIRNGEISNQSDPYFLAVGSYQFRSLSRRFPMIFFPSSEDGKKEGGWSKVLSSVKRDYNAAIHWSSGSHSISSTPISRQKAKQVFMEPELSGSFGIIDRDKFDEKKYNEKQTAACGDNRIRMLSRCCVENMIFDPAIFCLSIDSSIYTNIQEVSKKRFKDDVTENTFLQFQNTCERVKKLIEELDMKCLQIEIDQYFIQVRQFVETYVKCWGERKAEQKKEVLKCLENTSLASLSYLYIFQNKLCKFEYFVPQWILTLRGHYIEAAIFGEENADEIDVLTNNIRGGNLNFIPFDLVDDIFAIDNKIRTTVRSVIKPGKPERIYRSHLNNTDCQTSSEAILEHSSSSSSSSNTKPIINV